MESLNYSAFLPLVSSFFLESILSYSLLYVFHLFFFYFFFPLTFFLKVFYPIRSFMFSIFFFSSSKYSILFYSLFYVFHLFFLFFFLSSWKYSTRSCMSPISFFYFFFLLSFLIVSYSIRSSMFSISFSYFFFLSFFLHESTLSGSVLSFFLKVFYSALAFSLKVVFFHWPVPDPPWRLSAKIAYTCIKSTHLKKKYTLSIRYRLQP